MTLEPDFTLDKYISLCRIIQDLNYSFLSVRDYINLSYCATKPDKLIVIRHDVDRWITNSVRMAEAEKKMGISSTYYFRYPATYNSNIISYIHSLGHEIGYHYEDLSRNHGDDVQAIRDFRTHLNYFRSTVPIDTICMHGNPLSPYDNRNLWENYSIKDLDLIGEAYLSIPDLPYFTDTGRTWSGKRAFFDFMNEKKFIPNIVSTDDLMNWIKENSPPSLYITIHPERWAPNSYRFFASWSFDFLANILKGILRLLRRK
jgi:hypothetical protein